MTFHPQRRGMQAATSYTGSFRSKTSKSNVRVVARIRRLNEDERYCTTSIQPVLPEAPPPTRPAVQYVPAAKPESAAASSPATSRKGPFAFLTPKKKKSGSRCADNDEATPVIRNISQRLLPPTPERPMECETATCLTAQDKFFEFDVVLSDQASQKQVYETSVGDAVRRNLFQGYNTTIVAYGQTGSGKTYTMGGRRQAELANNSNRLFVRQDSSNQDLQVNPTTRTVDEDDGIIPRAVHDLFKAKQRHESSQVSIQLTYLEIYNDELRDLLVDGDSPLGGLKLCDHGDEGVLVKGLTSVVITSAHQVKTLMDEAAKRRTTGSTKMNMRSSRSHAICTLLVTINPTQDGASSTNDDQVVTAKLTLVDLAGSERIKETGVVGIHQQESININKDLFVLGKVVSALAEKSKASSPKSVHVPYRDSKLTRLLRDSLGGNCCTVMVACVSPADRNLDESVNTLRYAQRARTIQNSLNINKVMTVPMTPTECAAMRGENKRLKAKVVNLQKRIRRLEEKVGDDDDDDESISIVSSFTNDSLSLGGSFEESQPSSNGQSTSNGAQASFDVKKVTLSSLDFEINEKKELVERLRAEAAKLDAYLSGQKSEPRNSDGKRQSVAHAAPGTKIEMVAISKPADKCSVHHDMPERLPLEHADEIQVLEEKMNLATSRNDTLCQELASQNAKIDTLMQQEKDNEEKVSALVLQLEFEQKRLREHEESLQTTQKELRKAVDERDDYRMKVAVKADELDKLQKDLSSSKEAQEAEIEKLRLALHQSNTEIEGLKKAVEEEETHESNAVAQLQEEEDNKGVLSTRDVNIKGQIQDEGVKPSQPPAVSSQSDKGGSVCGNPASASTSVRGDSSVDTGGQHSVKSEHDAIRVQAAKMLFYANQAIEKSRGGSSTCSSLESSNGSEFQPDLKNIRALAHESGGVRRAAIPGRPPLAVDRKSPPRASSGDDQGAIISNLDQLKDMNRCSCNRNALFGGNPQHVEFYLPKIGTGCKCGKNAPSVGSFVEGDDPMALVNILRPWQLDFLESIKIKTAEELVKAYKKKGRHLAKKMRNWRRQQKMVAVKTKSCEVALHIWARTCKAVIRSVRMQLAAGVKNVKLPDILEVPSLTADSRTAVSSLGCGSYGSLAEF